MASSVPHSHAAVATAPNMLLQALNRDDVAHLEPHLTEWWGHTGDILHEQGDTIRFTYFPCGSSLVTHLLVLDDGRAIETAIVGREGALGGIVTQGPVTAHSRATVQFPGPFLRIEIDALEEAKVRSIALRHLFARYAECLVSQVFQSMACTAGHTIEQRTAKWLLAAAKRTGGSEIPLTQDRLAGLLGVGRSYISRVIQSLKVRGILETRRGSMLILSVQQMENLACGCEAALRCRFDDVLSGLYQPAMARVAATSA
jgi:CRP-like cAMP-binding protein